MKIPNNEESTETSLHFKGTVYWKEMMSRFTTPVIQNHPCMSEKSIRSNLRVCIIQEIRRKDSTACEDQTSKVLTLYFNKTETNCRRLVKVARIRFLTSLILKPTQMNAIQFKTRRSSHLFQYSKNYVSSTSNKS